MGGAETVIHVEGLGKQYIISHKQEPGGYVALRDVLADGIRSVSRRVLGKRSPEQDPTREAFWALKDVSFEVKRGEVVGIIGRNGAGKSTLLKVLSRITEPTEGRVNLNGRVASLLEVGTGFHPELTGRENIFLNGAILGMTRKEIKQKFDEIVDFAEVERFLDTPVKRYSSGMYVRLAFAVAAHLEPEILLVDEVLAVGDAGFQKKSLGKMSDAARGGRTVLFVSHNMVAVQRLCQRIVWLEQGRVVLDETAKEGVGKYLKKYADTGNTFWSGERARNEPTDRVELIWAKVDIGAGVESEGNKIDQDVCMSFEYMVRAEGIVLNLSIEIKNEDDIYVLSSPSLSDKVWGGQAHPRGTFQSTCTIPGGLLNDGAYRITVHFVEDTSRILFSFQDCLQFDLYDDGNDRGNWTGKWLGVVRPRLQWKTAHLTNSASTQTD